MGIQKRVRRVGELPVLALRGLVTFPGMQLHFDVGRRRSLAALAAAMNENQTAFLVLQSDIEKEEPEEKDLCKVGVVVQIKQVLKASGDIVRVMAEGVYRARIKATEDNGQYTVAHVQECLERPVTDYVQSQALIRECREAFREYAGLSAAVGPEVMRHTLGESDAGALADYMAFQTPMPAEDKQLLLETLSCEKRIHLLMTLLREEISILRLEESIHKQVHESMDRNQKEYYLREQLRVISDELGSGDNPVEEAEEYRQRIKELALPEDSKNALRRECDKLSKMPFGSHEATVVRGYLNTVLELPFGKTDKEHTNLPSAKRILDHDHYGMDKVKERILEILAVRQLSDDPKGQIICLVGPPGVGKTSIARSIASAMGRRFARVSLGGMRDESDIRGHRKTYIGAMPGRIIHGLKQAGSMNPVILLDEVDKMGNDFRGDPTSALLEVLDPEQNATFVDHFVEIPVDLSQVLFITTANDASAIPGPLYDRMDVIQMSGYTAREKTEICKRHLLRKQCHRNGLTLRQLRLSEETMRAIIAGYTREAGVRNLERCIASICRKTAKKIVEENVKSIRITPETLESLLGPRKYKEDVAAKKDEIGVVNGLAWTSVGGEMLPIEVAVLDGTGKLELTGSLGDVMKESAKTAVSFVRSRADLFHIDPTFYKNKDIHIHAPEGAVPKDGPSAGVTMATAMVSALTGIPVRHDVAMTGEVTLRGRVLPIGGLKEKTMAAYTHHMRTVIIPEENMPDLAEIDSEVKEALQFVPAEQMETVLRTALTEMPHTPTQSS